MHGAVEALKHDLGGLRTGRASTALLDPVHVEVYGASMPLNQVATVSAPEPRMLSVQVWDRSNVGPVEKAIRNRRARHQSRSPTARTSGSRSPI
jgi:ribosome recycling factor